jgi:hypothetical protein
MEENKMSHWPEKQKFPRCPYHPSYLFETWAELTAHIRAVHGGK